MYQKGPEFLREMADSKAGQNMYKMNVEYPVMPKKMRKYSK